MPKTAMHIDEVSAEETAHYVDIDMVYREGQGYLTRDGRPPK